MASPFAIARALTEQLRQVRGTVVGIAVNNGRFAVTETRGSKTTHITGWQSHANCIEYMRQLAEAADER